MTAQRSLVVLCVPLESPGATRGLLAMLPQLTTRHLVLVAAVTDPALLDGRGRARRRAPRYTGRPPPSAPLLDAERVAAAVRRLGGDVVSAAPLDLPPAVADRYLAYKAAGRL